MSNCKFSVFPSICAYDVLYSDLRQENFLMRAKSDEIFRQYEQLELEDPTPRKIDGETVTRDPVNSKVSGRESEKAQLSAARDLQYQPVTLEYGAPIRVKWTAPLNHSKKDWIGLYMIGDNTSKEITRVSSQGRWVATSKGSFESARAVYYACALADAMYHALRGGWGGGVDRLFIQYSSSSSSRSAGRPSSTPSRMPVIPRTRGRRL